MIDFQRLRFEPGKEKGTQLEERVVEVRYDPCRYTHACTRTHTRAPTSTFGHTHAVTCAHTKINKSTPTRKHTQRIR